MDLRVAKHSPNWAIADFGLLLRQLRLNGVADVPATEQERRKERSEESQELVKAWPAERIAGLEKRCNVPRKRVAALLGIGMAVLKKLSEGTYTPSSTLCSRMEQLEQMADRGELHGEWTPKDGQLQRRLALFRAWFMAKPPEKDFPLITVAVKFQWGKSFYSSITVPVEYLPQLRLTQWAGLVDVMKAITIALRNLARVKRAELWKDMERDFWHKYATDTLPAEVESRARSIEARLEKGRKKRGL